MIKHYLIKISRLLAYKIFYVFRQLFFSGSAKWWEQRYSSGGTSGEGSYGRLAEFKVEEVNKFVKENGVKSVIEFGCGDGNQLNFAHYPSYIGFDISKKAILTCQEKFFDNTSKNFFVYDPYNFDDIANQFKADLALSLDVIYHLVEDDLYIEMGTSEITANTKVLFINNLNDTTRLYNGPFTYKITGATLTDINNPINGVLRLAQLPVQIYNLELLCDGILIEGYLSLPADISKWTTNPAFGSTVVTATLNALKITQSQGIQFNANLYVSNVKIANKLKVNYLNISLNTIDDIFSGSCKL